MAQLTFILLSALAASFSIHSQFPNASPVVVSGEWAPRLSIWNNSPLVAAAPDSAMISEVVKFAPELSAAAAASNSRTEPTTTQWETTTFTVQSTVTAAPFNHVGLQSQTWTLPEAFKDLSLFSIDRIAYGSPHIAVVTGIPAKASATLASLTPVIIQPIFTKSVLTSPELPHRWINSCAYRLFFLQA
jgi:hypothetical protein